MPFVNIYLWKGRSKETRKKLIEKVTSAVVDSIDCPKDAVQVVITETDKENWGLGGVPSSEKYPEKN